ncbi:DUF1330 domain-containing protein [Portibacter lacus]|uniref:DUF1330 domain-containing protein n=1 Tax=Portibacter lacus TaxID=1099794 RepID=A0AA37WEZ6_9BACT|nr:DUF1330 domain-containing protein [Portibacter lacus]GLR17279.1 hypothetical protein GCM10007940_18940 [Portibacter lacus]
MVHITQLIYIQEGQEDVFHEFENVAIPIILKYNGRLTLRIRPDQTSVIEQHIEVPYEIHFVEFDTEEDFENFKKDDERKSILHLKEKSIRSSILIQGKQI